MKIGVDLRQLSLGASGGITQQVQGVFEAVFDRYTEHQFLVFCTPFNRSLLACDAEHVRYFSLSIASYFLDLDHIAAEEDLQVLFRSYPTEDTLQFPMHKQIVLIPDNQHETFPDFFAAEVLAARRSAFSKALGSARGNRYELRVFTQGLAGFSWNPLRRRLSDGAVFTGGAWAWKERPSAWRIRTAADS